MKDKKNNLKDFPFIKSLLIATTAFVVGTTVGVFGLTPIIKKPLASNDYNGLYLSTRDQLQATPKGELNDLEVDRLIGYLSLVANTANFTMEHTDNAALKNLAQQIASNQLQINSQLNALTNLQNETPNK